MKRLAFIFIVGCGGPPFSTMTESTVQDSTPPYTASGHDAGNQDANETTFIDAGIDAVIEEAADAKTDVQAEIDSSDSSTCQKEPVKNWSCSDNDGSVGVNGPGTFCTFGATQGLNGAISTPEACQCITHYTCACIVAALGNECGASNPILSCSETEGGPRVVCTK